MGRRPAQQLSDLCGYEGATLLRIEQVAPFLEHLAATKHAQEVLPDVGTEQWSSAAREVLVCVTRAGGAAGFDERSSRFARACLGLNGTVGTFPQRMDDLDNDVEFKYNTSRTTHLKKKNAVMEVLADRLVLLTRYPCAPQASRLKRALLEAILNHVPEFFEERIEDQRADLAQIFEELPGAVRLFDQHDPRFTPIERIRIVLTAISSRSYRALYERRAPLSQTLILSPRAVSQFFTDVPNPGPRDMLDRTAELLSRIMLDVEEQDAWERTLIASAEAEAGAFELTQAQTLRIQALFERMAD